MSCTEQKLKLTVRLAGLTLAACLTACTVNTPPARTPAPTPQAGAGQVAQPSAPLAPAPVGKVPAPLAPPKAVRKPDELRMQAALRLVAANPQMTYTGLVPEILLAIPVLEVELNRDGSVKNIHVLRKPGQAPETLQMAIDAVHRAAPFGDVSAMPRPWKFTETFLFNDERRFKPRTLD